MFENIKTMATTGGKRMNDRFRFRAWDRINDKWLSDKNCIEIGTGYLTDFYDVEQAFNRRYVLMQCTGLKDKNGKLIYEGDIVKIFHISGTMQGKLFTDVVEWNELRYRFDTEKYGVFDEDDTYEVIGNIYENKELLESEG